MRAFIGLGSNLGDRAGALRGAVRALDSVAGLRVVAASSCYETEPVGGPHQADYLNAVVEVETSLDPRALLDACHAIEDALGRDRSAEVRWGPRAIDLDLLVVGDLTVDEPGLQVPHPRLRERAFVLVPLAEVAPDLEVPGLGPVRDLAGRLLVGHSVRRAGSLV